MKTTTRMGLATVAAMAFAGMASAAPMSKMDYVKKAGAGDLYETRSSKLVLESSKDAHIRMIANQMITDHAKSTKMVKTAAMHSGFTPKPPMLDPEQRDMIAKLEAAKGRDRDTVYIDQQKVAHQKALALHQAYSDGGDAKPLKHVAGEIVPVVQHHIEMLDHGAM